VKQSINYEQVGDPLLSGNPFGGVVLPSSLRIPLETGAENYIGSRNVTSNYHSNTTIDEVVTSSVHMTEPPAEEQFPIGSKTRNAKTVRCALFFEIASCEGHANVLQYRLTIVRNVSGKNEGKCNRETICFGQGGGSHRGGGGFRIAENLH